ncbi:Uma2 family endonuclease [Synechocystis salina LEGE 06099]|uniref:Uma2 family endonuclease n=1 Tax=Synechocystis salina TaxID=945780 RepID=UPI00187FC87E|nr:Uma2 family endonuclease [Synechocystis salina]MBE9204109.1 Uma2 family endonuclease [Synechocystis salina LEGE 06099]
MQWQQICDDPLLQNLPYKIELNQWGQIVMSPARVKHGFFQNRIGSLLESLLTGGEVITECAIQTRDNVKVADVAWASDERADIILDEVSASIAPEICIEILSGSNTIEEMEFKQNLYFDAGAQEVWVCDRQGNVSFYIRGKQLESSEFVPDFPQQIKRRKNQN